jgi:chemotaxis protein MotB
MTAAKKLTIKDATSKLSGDNFKDNENKISRKLGHSNSDQNKSLLNSDDDSEIWLISYADMMTLLVGFFAMILSFSKIEPREFEKLKQATTQLFGGEYVIPHEKLKEKIDELLEQDNLKDQVIISNTDNGIEVTFRGALFFDSGNSDLKPEAQQIIEKLIPILKENAKNYSMVIEGHTDDNPILTQAFPSNWELSSFRASAVLRMFESKGFEKTKLKAVGWAETRPILPNRDDQNVAIPENQSQNRRVVLKISNSDDLTD